MRHLPLAAFLVLILLLAPAAGITASGDAKRLAEEKARAAAARKALQELTARERSVHKDLAEAEKRIKTLQERIGYAEEDVQDLRAAEEEISKEVKAMERKKHDSLAELERLLRNIWPVQVRRDVLRGRTLPEWEKADREFVWMAKVYESVERSLQDIRKQEAAIRKTLQEKRDLAEQAAKRLAAVNQDKDALLEQRLEFRRKLASVREKKLDQKEELENLLALVDELNYKLDKQREEQEKAQRRERLKLKETPFKQQKGRLPWPVQKQAKVVAPYAGGGKSSNNGMGFSLPENTPVHAVSWGRVVHNEVLRGFGRVVILLHGDDYYSVYAFLSSSELQKGAEVVPGDVVGLAGYYPKAKGPGVYFELRFHQKPINPRKWLIARK